MNLEAAMKHFSPKSLMISDSSRATASMALTGTDVMAALGMAQSRAELGFALFFAKHMKDRQSRDKAVKLLALVAIKIAPVTIGKVAGRRMAQAMLVLCGQAVEVYCRTADDPHARCPQCKGRRKVAAIALANGGGVVCDYALMGSAEGQLSEPKERECPRCHGTGLKASPSSRVYRAVNALLPELPQRTWSLNWKPLYEELISRCEAEESQADAQFMRITRGVTMAA
jgi:hypothetical protein